MYTSTHKHIDKHYSFGFKNTRCKFKFLEVLPKYANWARLEGELEEDEELGLARELKTSREGRG